MSGPGEFRMSLDTAMHRVADRPPIGGHQVVQRQTQADAEPVAERLGSAGAVDVRPLDRGREDKPVELVEHEATGTVGGETGGWHARDGQWECESCGSFIGQCQSAGGSPFLR
jgi:hypothetical protein